MSEHHDHSRRGRIILALHIILVVIGAIFVALRFFTRTVLRPGMLGAEDALLLGSLVSFTINKAYNKELQLTNWLTGVTLSYDGLYNYTYVHSI